MTAVCVWGEGSYPPGRTNPCHSTQADETGLSPRTSLVGFRQFQGPSVPEPEVAAPESQHLDSFLPQRRASSDEAMADDDAIADGSKVPAPAPAPLVRRSISPSVSRRVSFRQQPSHLSVTTAAAPEAPAVTLDSVDSPTASVRGRFSPRRSLSVGDSSNRLRIMGEIELQVSQG